MGTLSEKVEQIIEESQNDTSEVIQVGNLKKRYTNITALNGVSFSVKRGEVFGLLGPNGAGKTTTINILCTLSQPSSGVAYVNGYDVVHESAEVRNSIGLLFQETILDNHLTAEENLYLHAMLYGLSRKEYFERKKDLLKFCELWNKRKAKVETFSGGMKRRLELARALIHHPQVLFLDEPTIGLDPQTRKKIWDYIFSLRKKKNITIFLTTQYLSEAENCDRVAILDNGIIVALDRPENLKRMIGEDIISFRTENNQIAEREFQEKFSKFPIKRVGKELRVKVDNGDKFLPILVKAISPRIISMELRRPTLEDVFLEITGRKIRENNKEINEEEEEEKFDLSSLFSIFGPSNKKNE
ncbi:MAG: ATP-binding cassette domain-containing protein [Candidatus Pacebacteria bacterium]|nr:ATP-binding cassette domain-containing protein [Candidatus Paceibacterota bacterium]